MSEVTVHIRGLDELERKLKELPAQLAKRGMRKALRAGAKPIVSEMENQAPKRTGFLAENIITKIKLSPKDTQGTIKIGPASPGFYSRFLEFGTSKMAAQPFIRKSFEDQKQTALESFVSELKTALASLFR